DLLLNADFSGPYVVRVAGREGIAGGVGRVRQGAGNRVHVGVGEIHLTVIVDIAVLAVFPVQAQSSDKLRARNELPYGLSEEGDVLVLRLAAPIRVGPGIGNNQKGLAVTLEAPSEKADV